MTNSPSALPGISPTRGERPGGNAERPSLVETETGVCKETDAGARNALSTGNLSRLALCACWSMQFQNC